MRTSENSVKAKFVDSESSEVRFGAVPSTRLSLIVARLLLMTAEERPTGITYEDAIEAAKHGGNVDYEGRKVRMVSISGRTGRETPSSARLDLDLGNEYLVLLGYFRGGEFIEEGREHPF
jgi:hypothetical protein